MLKLRFPNLFLIIVPILIWNILFSSKLPLDHFFSLSAPQWLLVSENILRLIIFTLPLFMPINKENKYFIIGKRLFIFGVIIYFISWVVLIILPLENIVHMAWLLYMPAITPLVWLIGISLMGDLAIYSGLSILFIILHVSEFIFKYQQP